MSSIPSSSGTQFSLTADYSTSTGNTLSSAISYISSFEFPSIDGVVKITGIESQNVKLGRSGNLTDTGGYIPILIKIGLTKPATIAYYNYSDSGYSLSTSLYFKGYCEVVENGTLFKIGAEFANVTSSGGTRDINISSSVTFTGLYL